MTLYTVHYTHQISPSPNDRGKTIDLTPQDFQSAKLLARALRKRDVLITGARIVDYRMVGTKTIIFPRVPGMTTYWHSVTLTQVEDFSQLRPKHLCTHCNYALDHGQDVNPYRPYACPADHSNGPSYPHSINDAAAASIEYERRLKVFWTTTTTTFKPRS